MPDQGPSQPSEPTLISRFEGAGGKQRLLDVLGRQLLLAGKPEVIALLAEQMSVFAFPIGDESPIIIKEGSTDNSMLFVLSGSVQVQVKGRPVAVRQAGTHVGEMALLDPVTRRSASVVALEPCIFARIEEPAFTALADRFPSLWRGIALELGNRLRERSRYIRQPNSEPQVFIGSSREALELAHQVQVGLTGHSIVSRVWTDDVFQASATSIESLMEAVADADFAVLIATPDDQVHSRGATSPAPRDNVIFELGLFMGGLGRSRAILVKQRGQAIRLPSDLFGFTALEYLPGTPDTLSARIASVCVQLQRIVQAQGPR